MLKTDKLLVPVIIFAALAAGGCSRQQREAVPTVRDYQTDARIMAQFVEVNISTGLYYINPDKKLSAVDHVFSYSQEELMEVSPANRRIFLDEMDEANKLLTVMRQSAGIDGIFYSTYTSGHVESGKGSSGIDARCQTQAPSRRSHIASLDISGERTQVSPMFRAQKRMTVSVSSASESMFYVALLDFVDEADKTEASMVVSGVNLPSCSGNYSVTVPDLGDRWFRMSGTMLAGGGTVSVSLSE